MFKANIYRCEDCRCLVSGFEFAGVPACGDTVYPADTGSDLYEVSHVHWINKEYKRLCGIDFEVWVSPTTPEQARGVDVAVVEEVANEEAVCVEVPPPSIDISQFRLKQAQAQNQEMAAHIGKLRNQLNAAKAQMRAVAAERDDLHQDAQRWSKAAGEKSREIARLKEEARSLESRLALANDNTDKWIEVAKAHEQENKKLREGQRGGCRVNVYNSQGLLLVEDRPFAVVPRPGDKFRLPDGKEVFVSSLRFTQAGEPQIRVCRSYPVK